MCDGFGIVRGAFPVGHIGLRSSLGLAEFPKMRLPVAGFNGKGKMRSGVARQDFKPLGERPMG
jgi:hypothetical protein